MKRSLKRAIPSAVIYAVYVLGYSMGARTQHPNGLVVWLVTGAVLLAWMVLVGYVAERWFGPRPEASLPVVAADPSDTPSRGQSNP